MLFWLCPIKVWASSPPVLGTPTGLSLAEIKITGSEFLMLINNSGSTISDLSRYWLYVYNNVNPSASGVSLTTQQLPAASLGNQQTVLLSANGGLTCGAAVTGKLNLSFNDSGGFLQLVQTSFSGVVVSTAGDAVSWSSGINSVAGMLSNVPSNSSAPNNAYYRYQNSTDSSFLWQKADQDITNPCQLNVTISGVTSPGPVNPGSPVPPGAPPPVSFVNEPVESLNSVSNAGLAAPIINELLPNPAEPQSDSEDEFVELYNPNESAFDLSGYKLQTGMTTLRNYTFPAGTNLPPKSFVALSSADTNLSLSNSGSQVKLLDPQGNVINQTESYGKADDGQAWALGDGKWYWTSSPTPAQANTISAPNSSKKSAASSSKKLSTSSKPANKDGRVLGTLTAADSDNSGNESSEVHPLVLAGVGSMAVAYAMYEYRNDLANRLHQLRRYREARAAAGAEAATAGGSGVSGRFGRWQNDLRAWLSSRLGK